MSDSDKPVNHAAMLIKSGMLFQQVNEHFGEESAVSAVGGIMNDYINALQELKPGASVHRKWNGTSGLTDPNVFLINVRKLPCAGQYESCKSKEVTGDDVKALVNDANNQFNNAELEIDFDKELSQLMKEYESNARICPIFKKGSSSLPPDSSKDENISPFPSAKFNLDFRKIEEPIESPPKKILVRSPPKNIQKLEEPQKMPDKEFIPFGFKPKNKETSAGPSRPYRNQFDFKFGRSREEPPNRRPDSIIQHPQSPVQVPYKSPLTSVQPQPSSAAEKEQNIHRYKDFKSSRQELTIQNTKIYGNPNHIKPKDFNEPCALSTNNSQTVNEYKSLGGKVRVNKPYQLPFKKLEEPTRTQKVSQDEPVIQSEVTDEEMSNPHLKNVDRMMVEAVRNEILSNDESDKVRFNDVAGLEAAKRVVKEAVILPIERPDLFVGSRQPPKGILLFGPPGTGKTMIAKCIASESKATFFNISASSLTSKWIGEGEKMVRALFAYARVCSPSVVFIDEVDSLLTKRNHNEHDSTRKMKTEFLVQLDGAKVTDKDRVIIVGATNRPQELDDAAKRRFSRKLYIPLPNVEARTAVLTKNLQKDYHNLTPAQIDEIARLSDGYSCADLKCLCTEAAMIPLRFHLDQSVKNDDGIPPINIENYRQALSVIKASVSPDDLDQYIQWNKLYGSNET